MATSPAGMKTSAGGNSDTVQVYMTGLGMPGLGQNNATHLSGGSHWSADCISTDSYLAALSPTQGAPLSIDGAVIQSALLNTGNMAPCVLQADTDVPTAKIGGVDATVTY